VADIVVSGEVIFSVLVITNSVNKEKRMHYHDILINVHLLLSIKLHCI
jgi:hypothetical protein